MPSIERTTIGSEEWQRAASIYVRYKVFVLERGIAKEDEFDQNDTEERVYANLFIGEEPVSTGRFLPVGPGQARLTRIATLPNFRGKGYGKMIISSLEAYAP
uniref:N-acetyltransferase domain-containing protein n=1 Tax=Streptococcus suis TaxID=1307 RepID=Q8GG80_STRSU|nr:unknown [Streptococcus suis]